MVKSRSFQPTRFTTVPHSGSPSPDWQCLADAEPPVHDWLFDPGSLTRRLIQLSDDHFGVRVLLQDWQPLRDEECLALGVPSGSQGWVREVCLLGHGEPWVFARSVAARSSLQASEGLWARRSRFDRGALAVLVAEVFLPPVWQAVRNPVEHR